MRFITFLFVICCLSISLHAQEVEFHIPDEIEILQGQLSVVFNEDVKEVEALSIIAGYDYEVLKTNFTPVIVSGNVEAALDADLIHKITADESILTAHQFTMPGTILTTRTEDDPTPEHRISVTFAAGITKKQAEEALKKYIQLTSMDIQSLPNEVIISVGNEDQKAFDSLQENEHIRWVSYVGTSTSDF